MVRPLAGTILPIQPWRNVPRSITILVMNVTLTVTGGPHEGRVSEFREHDTLVVGRSDDAQFRLPFKDRTLSRVHFMIEVNPPWCRLMDMASTNGTFVNGRRVAVA